MMKRKAAAVLAAVLLIFAVFSGFTEPSPALWGYANILQAENFGLLKTGPGDVAEKEDLAVMIYTALEKGGKLKSSEDFSGEFSSVLTKYKISAGAKKSVAYGLKYGLWKGGDFAGPTAVTRELASQWLMNAAGVPERVLGILDVKDAGAAGGAFYGSIDTSVKAGLMQLGPDGGFHPELSMVRMEAASLSVGLYNFKGPSAGGTQKTDLAVLCGRVSAYDPATRSFLLNFETGSGGIRISENANILIDGYPGSFEDIRAYIGKTLTVSAVYEENQTVIVQTKPSVLKGTVTASVKKNDYTLLTINLNGTRAPYCITENTSGIRSFAVGETIRFIPDGCEIIEAAN